MRKTLLLLIVLFITPSLALAGPPTSQPAKKDTKTFDGLAKQYVENLNRPSSKPAVPTFTTVVKAKRVSKLKEKKIWAVSKKEYDSIMKASSDARHKAEVEKIAFLQKQLAQKRADSAWTAWADAFKSIGGLFFSLLFFYLILGGSISWGNTRAE